MSRCLSISKQRLRYHGMYQLLDIGLELQNTQHVSIAGRKEHILIVNVRLAT